MFHKTGSSVKLAIAALVLALVAQGCNAGQGDEERSCSGGKCDELDAAELAKSECLHKLGNRSTSDSSAPLPSSLVRDPLIQSIYMTDDHGCPTDARSIFDALEKADTLACTSGVRTRAISEAAELVGPNAGAPYRTVTTRQCGGRPESGIMVSLFGFSDGSGGVSLQGSQLPGGVEIMTFQRSDDDISTGVFNYYKEVGGKLNYFGNSIDFIKHGPGGPGVTSVRGCANCHDGGGPVMKEIDSPWIHWEGAGSTKMQELVANRPFLGERAGPNMLQLAVEDGLTRWTVERVRVASIELSLQDMLRPLFCPVELNVLSLNGFPGGAASLGRGQLWDPQLEQFIKKSIPPSVTGIRQDDYMRVLTAVGSRVPGTSAIDVTRGFTRPARATADMMYIKGLIEADIIDEEFVEDVLMVDFTRPVFSNDRCDLLERLPDIEPADRNPQAIAERIAEALETGGVEPGSPAEQLRSNLASANDRYWNDLVHFAGQCQARVSQTVSLPDGSQESAFLVDAIKLRSLANKIVFGQAPQASGSAAHRFDVFEFSQTLPQDLVQVSVNASATDPMAIHPAARLSPRTCELVSQFESLLP